MDALILASSSPRRAELLDQIGVAYRVVGPSVDEARRDGEKPASYVERLAQEKAEQVWGQIDDGMTVLSADTTVVCDDEVFGKPRDRDDARRMLARLSGRSHSVLTGVCAYDARGARSCVDASDVWFCDLSDAAIDAYLDSGEYADKAGAYAIQGAAARFIRRIEGSYSGVVGLPLHRVDELLVAERR